MFKTDIHALVCISYPNSVSPTLSGASQVSSTYCTLYYDVTVHECAPCRRTENVLNAEGNTPLHLAVINDNPQCVKLLLIHGADMHMSKHRAGCLNWVASSPGQRAMLKNWEWSSWGRG